MSAHPMLADVLGTITTRDAGWWWKHGPSVSPAAYLEFRDDEVATVADLQRPTKYIRKGIFSCAGYRYTSPADAVEALIARGLLPEHWSDEGRALRWWCERCEGRGLVGADGHASRAAGGWMCGACDSHTHTAAPPSLPALVAVASLGVDTLARVEAIVAETWRARLVWRVMTAAGLREHHGRDVTHADAAMVFSVEACMAAEAVGAFDVERMALHYDGRHPTAPAWPALCELFALGVHLLAVGDGRVVIGVEAPG